MLAFHRKSFEELHGAENALLVTGKGLGDWRVIIQSLRWSCSPNPDGTRKLVLVLNSTNSYSSQDDPDSFYWIDLCAWWGRLPLHELPVVINAHTLSAKRHSLYGKGGCYFITSRVLVADLLRRNFSPHSVTGVLVLRAHLIQETSNEAFAIRMIQQQFPQAFFRAFSDSALHIKSLPQLLRNVHCSRVFLYPRFRTDVRECLDDSSPSLIEVAQPFSAEMKEIQSGLVEACKLCLQELHRSMNNISLELSLEAVLFQGMDAVVRRGLDDLSPKQQQLFEDLKTIRNLLKDLIRLDCVSFYEKLLNAQKRGLDPLEIRSMWLFAECTNRVFCFAKARVFILEDTLRVVLEPHLKIKALQDILLEDDTKPVLILVRDSLTLGQICNYLSNKHFLKRKFLDFLQSQENLPPLLVEEKTRLEEELSTTFNRRAPFSDLEFRPQDCFHDGDSLAFVQPRCMVHLFSELREGALLDLLQPSRIVLYDLDQAALREIEVYQACLSSSAYRSRLTCFSLFYENSLEDQVNLSLAALERNSFLRLIEEKSHLVFKDSSTALEEEESLTRKRRRVVVVDMRELKAALPNLLQRANVDLDPRTLEVGDYILSPHLCVERKSLSDLISSFADGRLFHQATLMTRHYKKPVLLIEFPESGPFRLSTSSEGHSSLLQRLVLLLLHFPDLRVLWAKSPQSTVQLFHDLQNNQQDPVGDHAEMIEASGGSSEATTDEVSNFEAFELLKHLPGVSKDNCYRIAQGAGSLANLASLSQAHLCELAGENNGKVLHDFLHHKE